MLLVAGPFSDSGIVDVGTKEAAMLPALQLRRDAGTPSSLC
jgi:hypothetical protein